MDPGRPDRQHDQIANLQDHMLLWVHHQSEPKTILGNEIVFSGITKGKLIEIKLGFLANISPSRSEWGIPPQPKGQHCLNKQKYLQKQFSTKSDSWLALT